MGELFLGSKRQTFRKILGDKNSDKGGVGGLQFVKASLTRPAVKMPIMGPLTTPPMTIAASNIPGRYLEREGGGWQLGIFHMF